MEKEQGSSASIDQLETEEVPADVILKKNWKMGGRLISWLVGSNVLLFSCTLVTCVFSQDVDMWETDLLIFMSVMLVLCILWMFFQLYFSWKHKCAVLYKDCEAGPIWMRGGILLFGIGTLVMDCFKVIHAVGYLGCESPVKIIQPVLQAIFVIVQTYFLWISCKHCVQIHMNATRCGLMLMIIINLIIWVIAVTEESRHHTFELEKNLLDNLTENATTHSQDRMEDVHKCDCTFMCTFTPNEYYYLYPFNIEYNLFAAAMIYIMWKNVGRQTDENASKYHGIGLSVHRHIPLLGLISGLSVLIIGLVLFVLYEIRIEHTNKSLLSLTSFYLFHVISLVLMCLANLAGIIIFQLDERSMDNEKNPSRTLDKALLLGTTLGLHRLPPNPITNSSVVLDTTKSEFQREVSEEASESAITQYVDSINSASRDHHQTSDLANLRRPTITEQLKLHLKKRKTMKDIYLFLFLSNIIFWIMPAFGARIRFDNDLEVKFYGFTIWAIITNICLPFGIFYRMHAAASLLELYNKY
uniref:Otopetrin-2 n=1 Tax=Leptobrachium leishanense TaxID=445787 RepID=A0A8C5R472_9ANUR